MKANLVGGATISFGYLVNYFRRINQPFTLVNTKYFPKGSKKILNPLYIIWKVLSNIRKADVVFLNSSRGGTKYLVPILYILSKLFQKKFVFRPFGGNIKSYTAEYNGFQKWLFSQTVLKSDIFFLQTKELLQFYADQHSNTFQLPTSRDEISLEKRRGDRPFERRFIYLGIVRKEKGIEQIVEAAEVLGDDYTVHIYGPLFDAEYQERWASKGLIYKGLLDKEAVLATLGQYDVLMLPTFYDGEGYPGAIIEAYSMGLPVIATEWKAIPEIVRHEQTGRLIAPRSTEALVEAMRYFNESNYVDYSNQAQHYFLEEFSTDRVMERVLEQIKSLFLSGTTVIKTN